jgi:hypothetical protein
MWGLGPLAKQVLVRSLGTQLPWLSGNGKDTVGLGGFAHPQSPAYS